MGMYDLFGSIENQLKIFPVPYEFDGSLYFMGGYLRYYSEGDSVPYKTLYYNYTKNFVVINTDWDINQIYYFQDGKFSHVTEWDISEVIPAEVDNEYYEFYHKYHPVMIDRRGDDMVVSPDKLAEFFRNVRSKNNSAVCDSYYIYDDVDYELLGGYIQIISTENPSNDFIQEFKDLLVSMKITVSDYLEKIGATEEDAMLVESVIGLFS